MSGLLDVSAKLTGVKSILSFLLVPLIDLADLGILFLVGLFEVTYYRLFSISPSLSDTSSSIELD